MKLDLAGAESGLMPSLFPEFSIREQTVLESMQGALWVIARWVLGSGWNLREEKESLLISKNQYNVVKGATLRMLEYFLDFHAK